VSENTIVSPFKKNILLNQLGKSRQAKYIYNYLHEQGAKVFINEKKYIDKAFLIDYQKFYSRSFENIGRETDRIHFFSQNFSTDAFEKAIEENQTAFLNESYLGFVVVKPIKDTEGNPLIGRTLLKTYPTKSRGSTRFYVKKLHEVSLYGIKMKIESAPFQAQDRGVSACATVALWTALQSSPSHFDIPSYSPAEITEMSTEYPSLFRMFPQFGLTLGQMINCIHLVGLDTEVIKAQDDDVISTVVKAYTYAKIPIIGVLFMYSNAAPDAEPDAHAVVIVGYKKDKNGILSELYVHDDQIGPYSRVIPSGGLKNWNNEWASLGFSVVLDKLLIPIYHKIRLSFPTIYHQYMNKKANLSGEDLNLDLYLTTIQDYKEWLLGKRIENKVEELQRLLPRLLWIERASEKQSGTLIQDDVYDSTAISTKKLTSIYYEP